MRIYRSSLIWWGILLAIIWLIPVSFYSVANGSRSVLIALGLSASAGVIGTPIILVSTCLFYTRLVDGFREKLITFFRSIAVLFLLISALAVINEQAIKRATRLIRPAHAWMLQNTDHSQQLTAFREMSDSERAAFLSSLVKEQHTALATIDPAVLNHWIEESGYSFPSGHSFNAFLIAAILAFSLKYSRSKTANALYLLPYLWAVGVGVSRVSLGAHSEWDVTFGSLAGLLIGNLLLSFEPSRNLIMHRKYSQGSH